MDCLIVREVRATVSIPFQLQAVRLHLNSDLTWNMFPSVRPFPRIILDPLIQEPQSGLNGCKELHIGSPSRKL